MGTKLLARRTNHGWNFFPFLVEKFTGLQDGPVHAWMHGRKCELFMAFDNTAGSFVFGLPLLLAQPWVTW